jgi:hypothetical protein
LTILQKKKSFALDLLFITSNNRNKFTSLFPTIALNQASNVIIGIYNTTTRGSTDMSRYAIHNSTTAEYLNFGQSGSGSVSHSLGNTTVTCELRFETANDFPNRTPITVTVERSNATEIAALHLGSSWTLTYDFFTGISPTIDPVPSIYGSQQKISNIIVYDTSVQYSQSQIIDYI